MKETEIKYKEPLFSLSHVFWLLGAVCISLLFIIGGNAKSNDYTDSKIEKAAKAQSDNVDLKILVLKETVESIKQTQIDMKTDIKEIKNAVVTKK
jgi:hypothetical protein